MPHRPSGDEPQLGGQTPPTDDPGLGGEAALLHTLEALHDREAAVRSRALGQLGTAEDARVLDTLLGLLHDSQFSIRARAVALLGRYRDPRVVTALIDRLRDASEHKHVRVAAAKALGAMGDTGAVPALMATVERADRRTEDVAVVAIRSLIHLNDPRALPLLKRITRREISSLRWLSQVHIQAVRGWRALAGPQVVAIFIENLFASEYWAFAALLTLRDARCIPLLHAKIRESAVIDGSLMQRIIAVLEATNPAQAVAPLLDLRERVKYPELHSKEIHRALERIGTSEALAAVEGWHPPPSDPAVSSDPVLRVLDFYSRLTASIKSRTKR
jgi:hypothetical protein